ncbi:hypothetical protein [uncultured Sphingomonas sp.]|uniref:hypothetical protein n=1 Tax=uncultured Sphingomonas sp. TaxID=158754 RepID=UPI0025E76539|nr:hypothetical protein [uncultured Sphingomonas sp.]
MSVRYFCAVPASLVPAPSWTGECHACGTALAAGEQPLAKLIPVCPTCPTSDAKGA